MQHMPIGRLRFPVLPEQIERNTEVGKSIGVIGFGAQSLPEQAGSLGRVGGQPKAGEPNSTVNRSRLLSQCALKRGSGGVVLAKLRQRVATDQQSWYVVG